MQTVALIDYGSGNLRSAERALLAAAEAASKPVRVLVTADPEVVAAADRVVLPGQGAFDACWRGLSGVNGLIEALTEAARRRARPFLGICVGMQLLAETGLEHGRHPGLGWAGGVCRALDPGGGILPHMGWNEVRLLRPHPVFDAVSPAAYVYFAHSFVLEPGLSAMAATETTHGETFASAVAFDTILGVQFHPEKSQAAGLALLTKFLTWSP